MKKLKTQLKQGAKRLEVKASERLQDLVKAHAVRQVLITHGGALISAGDIVEIPGGGEFVIQSALSVSIDAARVRFAPSNFCQPVIIEDGPGLDAFAWKEGWADWADLVTNMDLPFCGKLITWE